MKVFVAVLSLLVLQASDARGAQLVYFQESPRGLYNFDTDTGLSTLRCAMTGTERFFGMDRRPSDGVVFAVDLVGSRLWNINIDNGQTSLIGALTPAIDRPEGITFNPQSGQLFVSSVLGDLYTVDPASAATTLIGHSGITVNGHSFSPDAASLLAFRQGSTQLYSINPTTAAATLIGSGLPSGAMEDSAFTPDGQFFGTDFHGGIYRVDETTSSSTLINTTGFGDGLLALISVPEPSSLALAVMVFPMLVRRRSREGKKENDERDVRQNEKEVT